ncbi:MAG: biotin transporter BioY [Treponema sp.]|jgi:biotin transport system substrate-specific component|nr:biotin transporter BioY [Treponema sp.]
MENKTSLSAKRRAITGITLIALFAALTAAGTFITIPLPISPVPVVLQNLFALLAGLILGPLLGGLAVGLYLIAGAVGAPVFAGAAGGFTRFLGPTGGFLLGYLFSAIVAGAIAGRPRGEEGKRLGRIIMGTFLGLLSVYVPGLIRLKMIMGTTWPAVLAAGFIPFLIGDILKGIAAVIIAPRLRRLAADQLDG